MPTKEGPQGGGAGVSLLQAAVWMSGKRPRSRAALPHIPGEGGLAPEVFPGWNLGAQTGSGVPVGDINLQDCWKVGWGGTGIIMILTIIPTFRWVGVA